MDYLTSSTLKTDVLSFELSKTVQITHQAVFDGGFAKVIAVLSFSFFLFRLNLSKIIVNHKNQKIKNPILLDST